MIIETIILIVLFGTFCLIYITEFNGIRKYKNNEATRALIVLSIGIYLIFVMKIILGW